MFSGEDTCKAEEDALAVCRSRNTTAHPNNDQEDNRIANENVSGSTNLGGSKRRTKHRRRRHRHRKTCRHTYRRKYRRR